MLAPPFLTRALLVALGLLGSRAPDEFREQLALLGAPRAAEREAAERWLQVHLAAERYPELVEVAVGADAEVRGRLTRVLSSDERHLGVALAFCGEADAKLQALGRDAVRASVVRADPRLAEPGLRQGIEGLLRRVASGGSPRSLRVEASLPLEAIVAEFELVGGLPMGLTLDARLATSTVRRAEGEWSGPWNEILLRVAASLGAELECHGLVRGRASQEPVPAFLHLATKGEPVPSAGELVSEWLFVLARDGDEPARRRAARNLASAGFAPAVAWMDHLVRTRGDRAAREGLLVAAAQGHVAPSLQSPAVLETLLDEAASEGGARSALILCGLARSGCFDATGTGLWSARLAKLGAATPRACWTLLFLLEKNGCALPGLEALVAPILAAPETAPALRLQALHTLAALAARSREPRPGHPRLEERVEGLGALFRLPLEARESERLGRVLAGLALAPPFPEPSSIPPDWTLAERGRLLQAWLWNGDPEPVAAHLAAWPRLPAAADVLADELHPWMLRGEAPRLGRALARAEGLAPDGGPSLGRLRLLLGLVPGAEVPAVLTRLGFAPGDAPADLRLLAALASYPVPIAAETGARTTLLGLLALALREDRSVAAESALLDALERTAWGLYESGRDELGDSFTVGVRKLLSRQKSALARVLERGSWPPVPPRDQHDLARELARFEVPASL